MEEILNHIYSTVLTLGIGVVGFFVKRSFDSLDKKADKEEYKKVTDDIRAIRAEIDQKSSRDDIQAVAADYKEIKHEIEQKGSGEEIRKLSDDLKNFRKEYATKEELKEIRSQMNEMKSSIDFLKEETVRKSDFIRVTAEIAAKIDDLSSYLRGKI